ncbi:MAG: phosphoglucomutase/phosphomannomutase family protein [Bacteroidales bacterium]|nr:phosphoglucomutase/phosphomannomutase family protein [Bacteroidales bacterium]
MNRIKFGTDGWRALIARDFTVENIVRISLACSNWLLRKYREASVVISYDCRFGGSMFAETVAKVMAAKGIEVFLSDRFTSTPALSMAVKTLAAEMGVMITASHNSFEYSGIKLKSIHGGPLFEEDIRDIENLINYENEVDLDLIRMENLIEKGLVKSINIEEFYLNEIRMNFNMHLLTASSSSIAVDPMFGSGQNVFPALFPEIHSIHNRQDYSFNNIPPEPLNKNLTKFSNFVKNNSGIRMGICLDGDGDRIALMDEDGKYVDSHHIILLLMHYLAGYKNQKGIIVTGFSSSVKVEKLANHYQLPVQRVKIGFKEISRLMLRQDVLVGGEESGGISVKGHIPERDGIWMALLIWQWMEESGKSLKELLDEIYEITGKFFYERKDLKIDKELRSRVMINCHNGTYTHFGPYEVIRVEDLDGYKYFLGPEKWIMIRPSGTEPLLRTYAEAETEAETSELLEICSEVIMNS